MRLDTRKYAFDADEQRKAILRDTEIARSALRMSRNRVLVATYVESETTKGGIIRPQRNLDESRFQGKVGLVLAMGPLAFRFDDPEEYQTPMPAFGDWIFYRASDTFECGFSGVLCRIVTDDAVMGILDNPEVIY